MVIGVILSDSYRGLQETIKLNIPSQQMANEHTQCRPEYGNRYSHEYEFD